MVSIYDIYGAVSPFQQPEFDLVEPGSNHTVLYKIDSGVSHLEPTIGHADKWDAFHVKMPNSPKCIQEGKKKDSRWIYVQKALGAEITNFEELLKAILSYNPKFCKDWKFPALKQLLAMEKDYAHKFFKKILPKMQVLALKLPTLIGAPIPLLRKNSNRSISMSQQQIACLLSNAFFCTYPRRNSTHPFNEYASYPKINFSSLFECNDYDSSGVLEKLKCLINYFDRVCSDPPKGFVTFSRRHVGFKGCPSWHTSQLPISSIPFHVDSETNIEDALGLIQVDFANKLLGGGVLGNGCVQEEIRFVICPELLVSMLFTEQLEDNEAFMVIGCERYSKYSGYGRQNFRFDGDYRDNTPLDGSRRRRCAVLAIDATKYYDDSAQFNQKCVNRELNKAWIGFSAMNCKNEDGLQRPGIATGNWGCGVFRGHPELKALIQIMACVQARRPMAYYTFLNNDFKNEFNSIYYALSTNKTTVEELYKMVIKYCDGYMWINNVSPFQYIYAALQKNEQFTQDTYFTETTRNRSPSYGKKDTSFSEATRNRSPSYGKKDTSFSEATRNKSPSYGQKDTSFSEATRNRSPSYGQKDTSFSEATRNRSPSYGQKDTSFSEATRNRSPSYGKTNLNTDPPLMTENMYKSGPSYMGSSMPVTGQPRNRSHCYSERDLNIGIASSEPELDNVIYYKGNSGSKNHLTRRTQKYVYVRIQWSCLVQRKFRKNGPRKRYVTETRHVDKKNSPGIKDCSVARSVTENAGTNHFKNPPSYAAVAQTKSSNKQTQLSYPSNRYSNKESAGWPSPSDRPTDYSTSSSAIGSHYNQISSNRPTDYSTSSSAIGSHYNQISSNKSDTKPSRCGAHPGFTRGRNKHNYTRFS